MALGRPEDTASEIVVLPGTHAHESGRLITVVAPRWHAPSGPERLLADAYRQAVAEANARGARSMALPAMLARGAWPLEDLTRVALTVLLSTPTSLHEVVICASTPAMLERWAEALVREP